MRILKGDKIMNNKTFVALSDFHSNNWVLDVIENQYLKEYDDIYILGDATDRGPYQDGTFGLDLLIKMKELCEKYPNIHYLPGNHDEFLYDAAINDSYLAILNLSMNHGGQTIADLERLKNNDRKTFDELFEWLGNQPLQMKIEVNNTKYALAHALFNNKVYEENKNYNLKDLEEHKTNKDILNIIWFRKNNDSYDNITLPDSDTTMIIGHSVQKSPVNQDLNLLNKDEEEIKVVCIDCGMENDGILFKYDGGDSSTVECFTIDKITPEKEILEDDVKIYVRKR